MALNLEELRVAGVSRSGIGWLTNPVRRALFRLALPYFEVVGRAMARQEPRPPDMEAVAQRAREAALGAIAQETQRAALEASAGIAIHLREEALGAIAQETQRAALEASAGIAIRVREEALAGVRADIRRELAGSRNEMRALSHRYTTIEETLETIKEWLAGVEQHAAMISDEIKAEITGLRERIATAEHLAGPGAGAEASALLGTSLRIAAGPYGRFLVRHPDVVGDAIIRGEFWDPHLEAAIAAHADPARVAIDAGAYIGFHTVFLSRHFARVYAFEPQRQAFNLLCANVELNGRRNVEAADIGLYSHPCWLRLAPDEQQEIAIPRDGGREIDYAAIGNAAALTFTKAEERTPDAVRAVTIDSLDLDQVGFIKIDTQGADFQVLRGAEETIRRCRPVIAFEVERALSELHATHWRDIQALFDELDYTLTEAHRTADGKQVDFLATPGR